MGKLSTRSLQKRGRQRDGLVCRVNSPTDLTYPTHLSYLTYY